MSKLPGYWRVNKVYKELMLNLLINNHISPEKNFLIFSDPRGGSTWLTELVNQVLNLPVIWEPLDLNYNKNIQEIGFGWREYLPENTYSPIVKEEFIQIFKGKRLNYYTGSQISLRGLNHYDNFLIKICRGGGLLPWITKSFDFEHMPIYLVRHPMAVISSQLRHGAWINTSDSFRIPSNLHQDIYDKHNEYLKTLNRQEEFLAAIWSINNNYVLQHPMSNIKWKVVFYEELFVNPEFVFSDILSTWNLTFNVEEVKFRQPSRMTKFNSPVDKIEQLSQWCDRLSPLQIENILNVMNYFGVTSYGKEIYPSNMN